MGVSRPRAQSMKGIFAVDYHPGHGSTRTLLHRVRSSRALKIGEFESIALIQTVTSMEFLLSIKDTVY